MNTGMTGLPTNYHGKQNDDGIVAYLSQGFQRNPDMDWGIAVV
jgi:hypothetical protein